MTVKKVFIIAGEPSGDNLGASLIRALLEKNPDIKIAGIGGEQMKQAGLARSLYPMSDLCVMGLFEVVPQIPRLLTLINKVVKDIEDFDPDCVVTVDLPDFNFRVQKKLRKRRRVQAKLFHYVAPTVWAWRPGRARKIARFLDGLICLFPFEPGYFKPHGLDSIFAGHPLCDIDVKAQAAYSKFDDIGKNKTKIGVLLGSRRSEIQRHGPDFIRAISLLQKGSPQIHAMILTFPEFEKEIRGMLHNLAPEVAYTLSTNAKDKWALFQACDAALCVSGTAGLELCYAKIPHIIAYKMQSLSWFLAKLLVKSRFAHLGNIIMGKAVIPEFLQKKCNAENLAKEMENVLKNGMHPDFFEIPKFLCKSKKSASDAAAEFVLKK